MLKKAIACALLLGAAMGGAHAAEQTWKLTWTGFDQIDGGWWGKAPAVWNPNKTLSTEFTGSDLNGNGMLELPELSHLSINTGNGAWNALACLGTSECKGEFEFGPNNILDFHLKQFWSTEYTYSEAWFHVGNTFGSRYTSTGSIQSEVNYAWTPATTLVVVAPAVPEPAEWAMFGAGAAVLGAAVRRRRKLGQAGATGAVGLMQGNAISP